MFGTYRPEDVTLLLKDITGLVEPKGTKEREREIQNGRHYCEMLPIEYEPSAEYKRIFEYALTRYSALAANAVASVAQKIWKKKGGNVTIVSLARAGTPIGILIKRYLKMKYGADVVHFTISIIRGRGIDGNAMRHILSRHPAESVQFVDGWTGKGAIQRELRKAMAEYKGVGAGLAVLSDPAHAAEICGTRDDFLIASSCLGSTVSGLLSRTFLRTDIIGPDDYHGAAFYGHLTDRDVTYRFIDSVQAEFDLEDRHFGEAFEEGMKEQDFAREAEGRGMGAVLKEVQEIADQHGIRDINLVKPGIGEATRVLLRRLPWKILVKSLNDEEHLGHLYQLAKEKEVEVVEYPLIHYRACGIIKALGDA